MLDSFSLQRGHSSDLPRVLLADGCVIERFGMRVVLESQHAAKVVGEVGDKEELFAELHRTPCDVVIIEFGVLDCQGGGGLALLEGLTKAFPAIHVLIITTLRSAGLLNALLHRGAKSVVDRNAGVTELLQTLKLTFHGHRSLSHGVQRLLAEADLRPMTSPHLTATELEVLRLFAYEGLTSHQISLRLERSRKTISHHKRSLQAKLGLMTDQELINYCHANPLESFSGGARKKRQITDGARPEEGRDLS